VPEIPLRSLRFPAVISAEELKCTLGFCLLDRSHFDAALGEVGPKFRCNLEAFFRHTLRRNLEDRRPIRIEPHFDIDAATGQWVSCSRL
jgi:hypothetical protein